MGSAAKFGMLVLMAMVIALARFLEGEVKPKRPQRVTKSEITQPDNRQPGRVQRVANRGNQLIEEVPTVHVRQLNNNPTPQPQPQPEAAPKRTYKVRKSDNLGKISKRCYGTTRYWKHILKANHKTLKGNERSLRPGMVLAIPDKPKK